MYKPPETSLAATLVSHLDERHQPDMLELVEYGDVEFFRGKDDWIEASIYDFSRERRAAFRWTPEQLEYDCNCARFKKVAPTPCEHVVAALMVAADDGLIDGTGAPVPRMVKALQKSASGSRAGARPTAAIDLTGTARLLGAPAAGEPAVAKLAPWKPYFSALRKAAVGRVENEYGRRPAWPAGKELLYVVDVLDTRMGRGLVIETHSREHKKDGTWKKPVAASMSLDLIAALPSAADREVVALLVGTEPAGGGYYYSQNVGSRRLLTPAHAAALVPRLCQSERCFLRRDRDAELDPQPLRWDGAAGAWELRIEVTRDEAQKRYLLSGHLVRGDERMEMHEPVLLTRGGLVFVGDRVAPLDDLGAFDWVPMLRERGVIHVPFDQADELLAELHTLPNLPKLSVPEELAVAEVTPPMKPTLKVTAPEKNSAYDTRLVGTVAFDYGGVMVSPEQAGPGVFQREARTLVRRDPAAESAAMRRLQALGFRESNSYYGSPLDHRLRLAPKALPPAIAALLKEGWHVEADGKLYRRPGEIKVEVNSGIDWFDLNVTADFGGITAPLPRLLAALRKGQSVVELGDGTFGVLPEEWLKKYAPLASAGTERDESVRFTRTQVGLLDALLASQPSVTVDATFSRVRDELRQFQGIAPADPPPTFTGLLRPYQREALGWFDFLRRFGFGGCLADDMGLGKTVQVLALLESRRLAQDGKKRPSLVVVPRSLVFNWTQEAGRFAPGVRVLDHSHPARAKSAEHFADYDLVLTTYGTLRRDAPYMKDVAFDYVVLDEAQAIKNAASESAKAARLLGGNHRLALSGTPVQNHLGDLWSLFDFLNPGMLGHTGAFAGSVSAGRNPEAETMRMLAQALRPFVLRRTKEQVAKDLPEKLEQTLFCELEPEQRKLYDELKEHYRHRLLGRIAREGMNKAKIEILEALLRLRQAACHPGLLDKKRAEGPSAKLDTLLPRLTEVIAEGHKALVFSQFTQFLALVKRPLDAQNITYEYLDGKTRDRQARVDRFQSDPDCKLFLISLKAGGVGLNLTAADYVFLLDPWWNPAVEAQAIDRTHRIGQTKQVFACRMIAKGTVEEKVLALQQTKRDLADAIINADNSLIRTLGREDLELLLS